MLPVMPGLKKAIRCKIMFNEKAILGKIMFNETFVSVGGKKGLKKAILCKIMFNKKAILWKIMFNEKAILWKIMFNETFTFGGKKKGNTVRLFWHEGISSSTAEDIASVLLAFLRKLENLKTITIWLNNCSTEGKN